MALGYHREPAPARGYYDIALRDFGLSLGALALANLALQLERH